MALVSFVFCFGSCFICINFFFVLVFSLGNVLLVECCLIFICLDLGEKGGGVAVADRVSE